MKTQSASANGDQSNLNTGREWSDAELMELGDLLMYEISIKEIARLLERDHGDVQDKVVEVGRACREGSSVARVSEPKRLTAGM